MAVQSYKLQQFEGPLDLLLQMIEQEKLDVSELSLAALAEQFVLYIESNPHDIKGEELADFLVVATQLLLLKSRGLVPNVDMDDELHPDILQTQLKLYRRFVDAAKRLQTRIAQRQFLYHRLKSPLLIQRRFSPPPALTAEQLRLSMQGVIERLRPIIILPESIMEKTVTLHEKMIHIQTLLKQAKGVSFRNLLDQSRSKTEKIVCFLALLELVKQEEIQVKQKGVFDDIVIERLDQEQQAAYIEHA